MKRLGLLAAASIFVLSGCGKSNDEKHAEQVIENTTGHKANVELSDSGVQISGKTKDGQDFKVTTGTETKIPTDFPKDVYIYASSTPVTAMETPNGCSVVLNTPDSVQKVATAYKQEMVKNSWEQETYMDMGPQTIMSFKKNHTTAAIVVMQPDNGKTTITITIDNSAN